MLQDGGIHEADLVIYAIGIKPRDELALAIGECASWKGNYYGLISPGSASYFFFHGIETDTDLFDSRNILSFNLTETNSHAPRKMNSPDLITKLKYVARFPLNDCLLKSCSDSWASFGDFFTTNA